MVLYLHLLVRRLFPFCCTFFCLVVGCALFHNEVIRRGFAPVFCSCQNWSDKDRANGVSFWAVEVMFNMRRCRSARSDMKILFAAFLFLLCGGRAFLFVHVWSNYLLLCGSGSRWSGFIWWYGFIRFHLLIWNVDTYTIDIWFVVVVVIVDMVVIFHIIHIWYNSYIIIYNPYMV